MTVRHALFTLSLVLGLAEVHCVPVHCVQIKDEGTRVDCSHRHLLYFPSNLPANTTWLDLSHNKIQDSGLKNLQKLPLLEYLDLSHNKISRLHNGIHELMPKLEEFYLDNNLLNLSYSSYPDEVFAGLRLRILHLHKNEPAEKGFYPDKVFGQLHFLEELKIDTFSNTSFSGGFGMMKQLKRLLLGFKGCQLTYLKNHTFQIFEDGNMEVLNLDHCPLRLVTVNAFWPLKSLKELYISNTIHLSPETAVKSMYGLRGRNMSTIHLNNLLGYSIFRGNLMQNNVLSSDALSYIKELCVRNASMRNNQLLWIEDVDWSNTSFARCITFLDLSENDIYGDSRLMFKFSLMTNLQYLDISRRFIKGVGYHFSEHQTGLLNEGMKIEFTLPSSLRYLYLNAFCFTVVKLSTDICIRNGQSLRELRFAFNGVLEFSNRIIGLDDLLSLDISGNTCGNMSREFFDDFSGLTKLNMSAAELNIPNDYLCVAGPRLLKPLVKLETIILSWNDLTLLSRDIFKANPLKLIDLSHNRFTSIPFDLQTTFLLRYLNLSFNSFTVIEQSDMDLLDRLGSENNLTVSLYGNTLSCGCENLDLIFWLYNTKVGFDDIGKYTCILEDGSFSTTSDAYNNLEMLWRSCYGKFWLSVSITCFFVTILGMVFIYTLGRRKTLILNVLLRLFGLNTLIRQPSRKDFKYDAFIGYSEQDHQYICDTVSRHVEDKHKMRMYITDRDMLPGRSIPQEIVAAIDSSWRVVLLLTHAFLEDNWGRFISDYAVYVSTFRPSGFVLLVLFDDVRRGDLSPAVLNVAEEKHIFSVAEFRGDEEALWRDVSRAVTAR